MKLLLFILLSIVSVTFGVVYQHKLRRIQSLKEKKIADGTWPDYVKERAAKVALTRNHGGQPEKDYSDAIYVSDFYLGTPKQHFTILYDTGSSNLWVPDKNCGQRQPGCSKHCHGNILVCIFNGCPLKCCKGSKSGDKRDKACDGKAKFDSSQSSTYKPDGRKWNIQYGTGSASGILGTDTVTFGNSGLSVADCTFGQATHLAAFFANQPLDGICGMAFQELAVDKVEPPFIKMMPQLDNPFFTVWMTALGSGNAGGNVGGAITFGDYDTQNCNMQSDGTGVTWVDLDSATYYQIIVSEIRAASVDHQGSFTAIVDTGTSLIAGPKRQVKEIGKALGGKWDSQYEIFFIDCNATPPPMIFTIDGKAYPVEYKNYIIPAGDGRCYLGIQGFGGGGFGPSWILGDCFIRQYCSIFDPQNKRVGFATAKH